MSIFIQLCMENASKNKIDRKTIVPKVLSIVKSILNKPEYTQLKKALHVGLKSSKPDKGLQSEFYDGTRSFIEIGTYRYEKFDKRFYDEYDNDEVFNKIILSFNKIFHKFCKECTEQSASSLRLACKIMSGEEMDKGEYQLLLKLKD